MEPNGTSKARGAALFVVTLPLCLGRGAAGVAWPDVVAAWGAAGTRLAFGALDWFVMLVVSGFLVLGAWLAFGPHRALRLGDRPPEFSTRPWLAMLFAAGILLLQAVALVRRLAAGDRAPTRAGAPTVSRR